MMNRIRTKICGITRLEDATDAVAHGADAIGLNFYSKGKRFVGEDVAAEIALVHARDVALFGVFVNADVAEVSRIARRMSLSHIQLHGDEEIEIVSQLRRELPDVLIARAIRIADDHMELAQAEIDRWIGAKVDLLLLDAVAPGEFGGTGHRLNWKQVAELNLPANWMLAGGLDPQNVVDAIRTAKPGGVDVASGVEDSPGIKNAQKVQKFISNANLILKESIS